MSISSNLTIGSGCKLGNWMIRSTFNTLFVWARPLNFSHFYKKHTTVSNPLRKWNLPSRLWLSRVTIELGNGNDWISDLWGLRAFIFTALAICKSRGNEQEEKETEQCLQAAEYCSAMWKRDPRSVSWMQRKTHYLCAWELVQKPNLLHNLPTSPNPLHVRITRKCSMFYFEIFLGLTHGLLGFIRRWQDQTSDTFFFGTQLYRPSNEANKPVAYMLTNLINFDK